MKDFWINISGRTDAMDAKLHNANNIQNYIAENEASFDDKNFYALLNVLIEKSGKPKVKVAADSCISEPYLYNLINGEKHPTRDTVVKLSFGLHLPLAITERLLRLAGHSGFYVRHKRDAILKFAIINSMSLMDANDLLVEQGLSIMKE